MLVLVHYSEIALKGGNRSMFEKKLVENIKKSLQSNGIVFSYIKRDFGRIIIEVEESQKRNIIIGALQNVFGISNFNFCLACQADIELIKQKAIEALKEKTFNSFCVRAKRADKGFTLTSQKINERVGEAIINNFNKKVDLISPDITIFIELASKQCFIYTEKNKGLGGLPVGASGKALCLLSGGIDSPVACFLAMKRGLECSFIHFHSKPYTKEESLEKAEALAKVLHKYQFKAKVYFMPFADVQKEIVLKAKGDLRVVLYRRLMLKIAEIIAKKEKSYALLTGENIAQVASQTLENMSVIDKATELLVLRPLLTYDKKDIIEKAKQIGTYEISILPHQDCCSRFVPKHPETKAKLREVEVEEAKLDIEKLIKSAVEKAEVKEIK